MAQRSKERAIKAMTAMGAMGFPRTKTKLVLKELVRTCENNWEHIEAENYSLLIEAILDSGEPEAEDLTEKKNRDDNLPSKQEEVLSSEEDGPHRKRLRKRQGSAGPLALYPRCLEKRDAPVEQQVVSDKGKSKDRSLVTCQKQNLICYKEPNIELGLSSSSETAMVCNEDPNIKPCLAFMPGGAALKVKDEKISYEPPLFEVPLAIIHPLPSGPARKEALDSGPPPNHQERDCERTFSSVNSSMAELNASLPAQVVNVENGENSSDDSRNKNSANGRVINTVEASSKTIEMLSSFIGDAKVSLSYNVVDCPNFQMPSLMSVVKKVEDKCLRSYKIFDPSFSLINIMKELCNTVLELGTESTETKLEDIIRITPALDLSKLPTIEKHVDGISACSANSSSGFQLSQGLDPMASQKPKHIAQPNVKGNGIDEIGHAVKERNPYIFESSSSLELIHQHEPVLGAIRPVHDVQDITKGEERVRISVVNEVSNEQYPPHFGYIPHNIVYQNAYLIFSLARIGDEDYCSDCFGNCLSASFPCACARETGGEFAYTLDGLLKKEFLEECISMNHDPEKHRLFYCKDCPLERSKNEVKPDPCKGHLVRKFIKECWCKCGCNKQCGNRVVQRGITCNLQVFFTPEGKGWGLRVLDDLPKGTFICEYVGEVLTNMELYDRTIKSTGNTKHTYPVLLDADWGSEGVLKDEEALCLDATFYGNVARFINHRCGDANLVEVPVEVETPDHHYYHLAFFTTRKIEACEELTWDYGIDFDDEDHPIKAFRCRCGSKLCRDRKRRKRAKSGAVILR
uniref:Histone-lysine N-methyltransferase SUVR4 n=1 Tax=Anthurium amnicola TaxID=1678845 RepID=A0A1D1Y0M4_9ARAE